MKEGQPLRLENGASLEGHRVTEAEAAMSSGGDTEVPTVRDGSYPVTDAVHRRAPADYKMINTGRDALLTPNNVAELIFLEVA